ncbi:MAG: hypothetical protein R3E82_16040 [Pseudomonadales bacterium]
MPTVIIGSALDIVEYCGVPRFLFVDFPLGNPCGKPWDRAMQQRIVRQAVSLFETIDAPQTTIVSSEVWGDDGWRDRYMAVNDANRDELARRGEELRQRRSSREHRPR